MNARAPIQQMSFSKIPKALSRFKLALKLTAREVELILAVQTWQYKEGRLPYPSKDAVAEMLGYSVSALDRVIAGLTERKLLKRTKRSYAHTWIWDFRPLWEACEKLEREAASKGQDRGLDTEDPEEMRHEEGSLNACAVDVTIRHGRTSDRDMGGRHPVTWEGELLREEREEEESDETSEDPEVSPPGSDPEGEKSEMSEGGRVGGVEGDMGIENLKKIAEGSMVRTDHVRATRDAQRRIRAEASGKKWPALARMEAVWMDEIGSLQPLIELSPWDAKRFGQGKRLLMLYGEHAEQIMIDAIKYLVRNWPRLGKRLFKNSAESIPTFDVLVRFHEKLTAESQLWSKYAGAIEARDKWMAAHPDSLKAPSEIETAAQAGLEALKGLGIG